jgi:hypothetical protein
MNPPKTVRPLLSMMQTVIAWWKHRNLDLGIILQNPMVKRQRPDVNKTNLCHNKEKRRKSNPPKEIRSRKRLV